jgi:hypothetical protein
LSITAKRYLTIAPQPWLFVNAAAIEVHNAADVEQSSASSQRCFITKKGQAAATQLQQAFSP